MARVKVPLVVTNTATGLPVNGASVAISLRATGAPATWYTTETGGTGSTASVATDASGRVTAWVDRGAYNATISGTGITTYTESFDAATASNASVDQVWVDGTVLLSGELRMYAGAAAPPGWLLCDGSLVSRTTYAGLFNAIGTAYGAGDGSTTFALPDMRGRSPVGAGTGSGLTARTRGQTGGEETHWLLAAETGVNGNGIVSTGGAHSHTIHAVNIDSSAATPNVGNLVAYGSTARQFDAFPSIGGDGTHAHGMVARNADVPHNVMHPFAVVNFIIKS